MTTSTIQNWKKKSYVNTQAIKAQWESALQVYLRKRFLVYTLIVCRGSCLILDLSPWTIHRRGSGCSLQIKVTIHPWDVLAACQSLLFRWQRGHSFELGQKADARVKLAEIHNEANLQLGEANYEACLPNLGKPNTQACVPVGAAANWETNMDQVDSCSNFEMGSWLGATLQSCDQNLAEERTWLRQVVSSIWDQHKILVATFLDIIFDSRHIWSQCHINI